MVRHRPEPASTLAPEIPPELSELIDHWYTIHRGIGPQENRVISFAPTEDRTLAREEPRAMEAEE